MQTFYLIIRNGLTYVVEATKRVLNTINVQSSVAMLHRKKSKNMSNSYSLAVASVVLLLCSCQKGKLADDAAINSTNLSSTSASARWHHSHSGGGNDDGT